MTNEQLMYAAILALTPQNQAFKLAPLSTQTMQGVVINRNIAVGETVVCWENSGGELTRVGDVPPFEGTKYFVNDKNQMFYKKQNEDILVECNALTGEIVDETEECYRWVVSGDGQCAAWCNEYDDDGRWSKWYVLYKDGNLSRNIRLERGLHTTGFPSYPYIFGFGYRNGILAIAHSDTDSSGQIVTTYTQDGMELYTLAFDGSIYPSFDIICPINEQLVCIFETTATAIYNYNQARVFYFDTFQVGTIDPIAEYGSYQGVQVRWIGTDGVYCYLAVRIYSEGVWQDEWDILKFGIDAYSKSKIKTIYGELSYGGTASTFGHVVQQVVNNGSTTREMIDISTMNQAFAADLPDPPRTYIQENNGWIWIPDSGVYQKTPLDWLMMPSGEYPRDEPWGKCGYAIGNYKVGQNGLAIVLFE